MLEEDAITTQKIHKRIISSFPISKVYQAHVPSYATGHWLFGFASKVYHPVRNLDSVSWNMKGISTRYYTTNLHSGSFTLPYYVEELLKNVE